jgi:uncharacterized protein YggE
MEQFISMYQTKLKTTLILFNVFLFVLVLFIVFQTINTIEEQKFIGSDITTQSTITVSGEGSVLAIPDIAEFTFSVQYEAKEVPEAQEEVADKINEITSFLKEEGIEEKNIKTVGYSTYPRYEWRSSNRPEVSSNFGRERVLVGYEVIHTTKVTVKKMEDAGDLVGGVGEIGATNISGINFLVENEDDLKKEARSLAIDNAKEEAEALSKDLGVEIIRLIDFNESSFIPSYMTSRALSESDSMGAEVSFEAGEEEINSRVQIRFEVK